MCSKKIKIISLVSALLAINTSAYAFENVAYVETNSNALSNVACFVDSQTQKPFFNTAVIFALNVDGTDPNKAYVSINDQDQKLLASGIVEQLHKQGIKVVAALLGNHQEAGWSTVTTQDGVNSLVKSITATVNKYNLDGIAIDDEYTTETASNPFNAQSTLNIVKALSQSKDFSGKTIQYVLLPLNNEGKYHQKEILSAKDSSGKNLSDYLTSATPGYYTSNTSSIDLTPFLNYGFKAQQLYQSIELPDPSDVQANNLKARQLKQTATVKAKQAQGESWGGFMAYNLNKDSLSTLQSVYSSMYPGSTLIAKKNCLK